MKITKKDIKGILKVVLIIVLVAAAIGGTCYFFFKQFNKNIDSYASVSNYVYSAEREEFILDLQNINSIENSNGRLNSGINAINQLNSSAKVLSSYLTSVKVDDKAVNKALNEVKGKEAVCADAVLEYLDRTTDPTFNRNNVNKVQTTLAGFLVSYSNLINSLNSQIEENLKYKQIDIKFAVLDCYTRVVANTFKNLTTDVVAPKNTANFEVFKTIINFTNTNLNVINNNYSNILGFINCYKDADKQAFAENLATNLVTYKNFDSNYNSLQKASYFFGLIFKEVA